MKKRNMTLLTAIAAAVAFAPTAQAAATFIGGTGTDWNTAANWNPAGVPTLASGNLTIDANASVTTDTNDIGGTLTVNSGKVLTIGAKLGYALAETNLDVIINGTITQNGGNVRFSDDTRTAAGTHNMNGGTFFNRDYYRWDTASVLDIRGGSFTIAGASGTGFNPNGKAGTLRVVGDAASLISFSNIQGFSLGILDMVLKDGGIRKIDVTGAANLPGTLNVTLDAGFTPVVGDYTLISAGSLSGAIGTVNLPSANWSVNTVGTNVVLTYVPEPSSLSLLALGGLVLLRRRRA